MALHYRRTVGYCLNFVRTRSNLLHLSSYSLVNSFSSLEVHPKFSNESPSNPTKQTDTVAQERYILNELSELLHISSRDPAPNLFKENIPEKRIEGRPIDSFLLPEDKLRGMFLQKLKGKTAIENALTSADVDLNLTVIARVVDRGNLSGEAMVMFFDWAIKQPSVPKDVNVYHVILKALGRRKFFKFMMEILHQMGKEATKPNLETITIVLDNLVRAHHVHKAIKLLDNLEEYGLECDTESLNVLLRCLCRRSHVGAANSLFRTKIGKMNFDRTTYNILMSGWSKLGRVEEIEKILNSMLADGINPDCSSYAHLIEGLGRAGRISNAVEVFNHLNDNSCIPDSSIFNAMIYNYISLGDLDESVRYYRSMLDNNCRPNLATYTKLISGMLKARKVADALELFEEMTGQGIVPPTGTITSFIEPLCSYGPPHAAMVIYEKARRVGCDISLSAYKLLLMRLSRFGKCGMILNLWDEMQESGFPCDMEVYEYVINGLCNIGQLENAVLVMHEAIQKGFCPGRLICSKLNNKLLASNKIEIAYKLYLKIKDARLHDNARRYWRSNGWHF